MKFAQLTDLLAMKQLKNAKKNKQFPESDGSSEIHLARRIEAFRFIPHWNFS